MIYVQRDSAGNIVAINAQASADCAEPVTPTSPELREILAHTDTPEKEERTIRMLESDLDFIRVLEDLISVLVEKNVICFTDLPEVVQQKINRRRTIRAALSRDMNLLDDDNFLI